MTSVFPPAAVPGPDDVPQAERDDDRQPDPFGRPTDEEGGSRQEGDEPGRDHRDDPRAE